METLKLWDVLHGSVVSCFLSLCGSLSHAFASDVSCEEFPPLEKEEVRAQLLDVTIGSDLSHLGISSSEHCQVFLVEQRNLAANRKISKRDLCAWFLFFTTGSACTLFPHML